MGIDVGRSGIVQRIYMASQVMGAPGGTCGFRGLTEGLKKEIDGKKHCMKKHCSDRPITQHSGFEGCLSETSWEKHQWQPALLLVLLGRLAEQAVVRAVTV